MVMAFQSSSRRLDNSAVRCTIQSEQRERTTHDWSGNKSNASRIVSSVSVIKIREGEVCRRLVKPFGDHRDELVFRVFLCDRGGEELPVGY